MAKYIDRDSLIEWLKRIRLIDLSDGLGICRVIMEDDFKKAIKNMPENIIVDVAPVIRCKDCKYRDGTPGQPNILCTQMHEDDFCSYGECREGKDEK